MSEERNRLYLVNPHQPVYPGMWFTGQPNVNVKIKHEQWKTQDCTIDEIQVAGKPVEKVDGKWPTLDVGVADQIGVKVFPRGSSPRVAAFCTYNDYGREKPIIFPLGSCKVPPELGEIPLAIEGRHGKTYIATHSRNIRLVELFIDGDLGIEVDSIQYGNICHLVGQSSVPVPFFREGVGIDWPLPAGCRAILNVHNTSEQWLYIREAYFTIQDFTEST